tara:strand:- start:2669 stop:3637 length:969 start_codon:yes stop_codon:yes gene_type:complete
MKNLKMLQKDKTSNYLIIGNGSIAERHIKIIKKYDSFSKIYVFIRTKNIPINNSRKITYIKSFNKKFCEEIDYFYICTPTSSHKYYLFKFLKYKKSKIFLEKPLNISSFSKNEINNLIPDQNRIHIGYNMRFMNIIQYFKKNIISKNIFLIKVDTSNNLKYWRKTNYKKSVTANKNKGGGIILELSHELDYLYSIFKSLEIKYSFNKKLSNLKINVEDILHLHLINKNKTNIILNMNMFSSLEERTLKVFSEDKVYFLDLIKNKILIYSNRYKLIKKLSFKNDLRDSYIRQFNNFRYGKHTNFERCRIIDANKILQTIEILR